jgi:hypothetical protein
LVPVKTMEYCYKNRLTKELMLLLYLKMTTDGKFKLSNEKNILTDLGIKNKPTLRKKINKLASLNFVGWDKKNGILHVRSFKRAQQETNAECTSYARIYAEELISLNRFKSWLTGSLVKSIDEKIRYRSGRVIHGKDQMTKPSLSYVPDKLEKGLAVRYFSASTGVSKSKAQRDLKLAEKNKLVSRQSRTIPLEFYKNGHIVYQPNKRDLSVVYYDFPALFGRISMKHASGVGLVPHIRIADKLYSAVEVVKRRKFRVCK